MKPNVPIRRYLAAVERHINGKVERALPTPESCPEDRIGESRETLCSPNVAIIGHVFFFGVAPCFTLLEFAYQRLGFRDMCMCIEFAASASTIQFAFERRRDYSGCCIPPMLSGLRHVEKKDLDFFLLIYMVAGKNPSPVCLWHCLMKST